MPPINATMKKTNCLIKKYVEVLLYLKIAAIDDEEKTIRRPILHKIIVANNKGLSILANIFFIPLSYHKSLYKKINY